jgi:hypothetical protein
MTKGLSKEEILRLFDDTMKVVKSELSELRALGESTSELEPMLKVLEEKRPLIPSLLNRGDKKSVTSILLKLNSFEDEIHRGLSQYEEVEVPQLPEAETVERLEEAEEKLEPEKPPAETAKKPPVEVMKKEEKIMGVFDKVMEKINSKIEMLGERGIDTSELTFSAQLLAMRKKDLELAIKGHDELTMNDILTDLNRFWKLIKRKIESTEEKEQPPPPEEKKLFRAEKPPVEELEAPPIEELEAPPLLPGELRIRKIDIKEEPIPFEEAEEEVEKPPEDEEWKKLEEETLSKYEKTMKKVERYISETEKQELDVYKLKSLFKLKLILAKQESALKQLRAAFDEHDVKKVSSLRASMNEQDKDIRNKIRPASPMMLE